MDISKLVATGLSAPQAEAYSLLIEHGQINAAAAAEQLNLSRTNAYKLLDKLVELRLARKEKSHKKFVYLASNPLALANLSAEFRAQAVAREEAVNGLMHQLLEHYYHHTKQPHVEVVTGRQAVASAYRKQINLKEDIYFIHTKTDVAMMGFDTMHEIRIAPGHHGNQRYGILAAPTKGPVNYGPHKRGRLEVTWLDKDQYNAPVEWSVTKSSLLIILYASEPHAILIADPIVAIAFLQLWHLLNSFLQQQPTHKQWEAK